MKKCGFGEDDVNDMDDTRDGHLPNLARLVVQNQGARVVGPAGTGKTQLIETIASEVQRQHPEDVFIRVSLHI